EIGEEARAAQPRPAQLPAPYVGGAAVAERLWERPIDEPHLEPRAAHHLGGGGVFSDFARQCSDAARALEVRAPPQHGLALGEAEAQRVGEILPARLIGIEERAFELGPYALRPAADRRRGDEPGIRAPARKQAVDVVARHQ